MRMQSKNFPDATEISVALENLYGAELIARASKYGEEQIVKMSSGVVLDDGVKTRPAVIHVVTDEPGRTVMEITLHEGRNRQIRKMCEALGLEVARLKRTAVGSVKLGMLPQGKWRELNDDEVHKLMTACSMKPPKK